MAENIAALVLAAGESRRMGEPKQLLPWGAHTIIEQIVETLVASPVDEILVVLGHRAGEIGAKVAAFTARSHCDPVRNSARVRTTLNPDYRSGMLSSLQHGIRTLAQDTHASFIVLCDQPQLKASTLRALRTAFEQSGRGIVAPSFAMRRGHPLLIDLRKYKYEILAIDGAPGLQKLLREHTDDILHVNIDDPAVLVDLDTREQYERARRET